MIKTNAIYGIYSIYFVVLTGVAIKIIAQVIYKMLFPTHRKGSVKQGTLLV